MFYIAFECVDDGNNFGYKPECEADFNQYSTDDLQDITKAGLGTAGREVVVNIDFIVFLLIFLFILGLIGVLVLRSRGFLGGKQT